MEDGPSLRPRREPEGEPLRQARRTRPGDVDADLIEVRVRPCKCDGLGPPTDAPHLVGPFTVNERAWRGMQARARVSRGALRAAAPRAAMMLALVPVLIIGPRFLVSLFSPPRTFVGPVAQRDEIPDVELPGFWAGIARSERSRDVPRHPVDAEGREKGDTEIVSDRPASEKTFLMNAGSPVESRLGPAQRRIERCLAVDGERADRRNEDVAFSDDLLHAFGTCHVGYRRVQPTQGIRK